MVLKKTLLDNSRDARSLFWSLGLFPLMPVVAVLWPRLSFFFWPVALYLGFSAGVLSHYHNHRGVFRRGWQNQCYSLWLSVFYGFPIFAWIPTHNQNHHKYLNGANDATRTDRIGRPDSLIAAALYPLQSSAWQWPSLRSYMQQVRQKKPRMFAWLVLQASAVIIVHACFWGVSVACNGLSLGSLSYALLAAIPALFASWAMMFINYVQHVGCDSESKDNHSRNFVGSWENWLVFDAGLHTVHHENPGVHWSAYRELHQARVQAIHRALQQRNVLTFLAKRYVLGKERLEDF